MAGNVNFRNFRAGLYSAPGGRAARRGPVERHRSAAARCANRDSRKEGWRVIYIDESHEQSVVLTQSYPLSWSEHLIGLASPVHVCERCLFGCNLDSTSLFETPNDMSKTFTLELVSRPVTLYRYPSVDLLSTFGRPSPLRLYLTFSLLSCMLFFSSAYSVPSPVERLMSLA